MWVIAFELVLVPVVVGSLEWELVSFDRGQVPLRLTSEFPMVVTMVVGVLDSGMAPACLGALGWVVVEMWAMTLSHIGVSGVVTCVGVVVGAWTGCLWPRSVAMTSV